ncbi:MAG: FAD-dependent oxidoreductase [Pseudanabaenaceae cyanobacterium bins.68]|nr:FAD-dependent oxidoreductase [Pseudanabaenaceae cyanobacterium bins.68]
MPEKYYIIGAGVAGITAAEQIRRTAPTAEIWVVNGEHYPFYRRLSLSSYLQGQTSLEALIVKQPQDYAALNIQVIQDRAIALQPTTQTLTLAERGDLPYDGLIIATGGSAIKPPLPGIELEGVNLGYWDMVHTLWYEENAKKYAGKQAVVIGGGVLGLELADCLNHAGMAVTIVQLGQTLGEPLTDHAAGKILYDRVVASGVAVHLGVSALEILGNEGKVAGVKLSNGLEIGADLVGVCIGIRPNLSWLGGSGIEITQGAIAVDQFLQTNLPRVYAAGDCTLVQTGNTVGDRPNRTWQVATSQGIVAAANLLGAATVYQEGLFYNAGVLYDLPYTMLGKFNPDPSDRTCQTYTYDPGDDPYAYFKLTVSEHGLLVGAMLLGKQRRTNILRKIIEGNYLVTGHEQELMDSKFKPTGLPTADVAIAGDAEVEAKLAAYDKSGAADR